MTIFLSIYLTFFFYISKKTKYKALFNELYWLALFWVLILGTYIISGIRFGKYGLSIDTILYLGLCWGLLLLGRQRGKHSKVRILGEEKKQRGSFVFLLGLAGVILYVFDVIRLNGLAVILYREVGQKGEIELSLLGIIGSFLIPILLVQGLYLYAHKLIYSNKISIVGLLLLFGYLIPCVLNSGRENILFVAIGLAVIHGYNSYIKINREQKKDIRWTFIKLAAFLLLIGVVWIMVSISEDRFTDVQVRIFLNNYDVSNAAIVDAEKWGDFSFLYYNIISYFSRQIAFFDFIFNEYEGPYLGGLYELNILSRRLPESWNLDYRSVYIQIQRLYSSNHIDFGNGWFTLFGSFIIDFGRIGTLVVSYLCGVLLGKIRKKFELTHDIRYLVLIALVCLSSFSTIQLGPFYQTLIYGTYMWWYIAFGRKEINKRHISNEVVTIRQSNREA